MEEIIRNVAVLVSTISALYYIIRKPNVQVKQENWEKFLSTFFLVFAATNLFNVLVTNKLIYGQEHIKTITYLSMAIFFTIQSVKVYKYSREQKGQL